MKKLAALLLVLLLGVWLTGCAAGADGDVEAACRPEDTLSAQIMPAETAPVAQIILPAPPEPEPDYALCIASEPIPTVVGCVVTDCIPTYFINNTGEAAQVLLIPHLEKLDENGAWAEVPFKDGVGFCGTPDPLPVEGKEWSWEISALWGTLDAGQYRLSCKAGPASGLDRTVSGEFTLFTPENNAGLPLAPRD